LRREISGFIGLIGGLIDAFVGLLILQRNPMGMGSPMMSASSAFAGYSLLALGAIVFLTGVYVLVARMMEHRSMIGLLMTVYGVVMLVLGAGMIGQLFNIMMQGSTVSGITMILVGLAMLYSGSQMTRTPGEKMM
jgi:drug/metabolite transporter (DMT)-like permease